ncbi:hypothetical protein [Neobacillus niacini]|uniref:hypothetical protein n=1 Tax=Neobacillus niacini TaxID=86668 RepID=UPI0039835168
MESVHQDPVFFYKKLEKECNKRIHTYTNSLTFTHAFGKAVETHLDNVVMQQKVINNWLTILNVPKKDDFANLASRKVDIEDRIDNLDDILFIINKGLKKNHLRLKELHTSLSDFQCLMEEEVNDLKAKKIKTLKTELEDLKKLFID